MSSQRCHQNLFYTMMFRAVFWVILPCKMIVDRRFRDPWWWRQYAPLKRRSTIILHGSITQKTALNIILAAVRTWNLTYFTPLKHTSVFHSFFMWSSFYYCLFISQAFSSHELFQLKH